MVVHSSFGSPSFQLVAKGLVALHRLIKAGKDDSSEAEAIRDAMDAPLKTLNRIEKERAQWLSEDLYSVSEPPATTTQKEMNAQAQQQFYEAIEARRGREWDRALTLLRRWREHTSPALLSLQRGLIWLEAGNPDVAIVFFRYASESDPSNAMYQASYLHALAESDPDAAAKLAEKVLADDNKYAPAVVARAAGILRSNEARTVSDAGSAQLYRRLISILERNKARIEKDEDAAGRVLAFAMTIGLLGFCHEFLGNTGAAVSCYSLGLQVNPNNDALFTARGILQYGTSPRAISDFEQAVELRCPVVWPYLFLAHHCLGTSQFEQSRAMCEAGLKMNGSDSAKSQLEEWRAIAQAELGFPPELVRAAFESAIRLDPSNELAKRNRDLFEASLRAPRVRPTLSNWEQKSVAAIRNLGLAERRYSLAA